MLGNCNKMVFITSTSNGWSQPIHRHQQHQQQQEEEELLDEEGMMIAAGSSSRMMEKPTPEQIQQQHQLVLKCPRCDSTNTKFCYYNNYSLSQPRHFCKACKRYWTRGGTLRNVPVGGGCRKNKRVKRTPASSSSSTTCTDLNPSLLPPHIDSIASTSSHHMNPLFYGLATNPSNMDYLFSRYDHHLQPHQSNGSSNLGLGFSCNGILNNHGESGDCDQYRNGYNSSRQIIEDLISSNSMLSNYNTFGSSSSSTTTTTNSTTTTTTPTLSSLLASTLQQHQQHKFMSNGLKENQGGSGFQRLLPYEGLQLKGNNSSLSGMFMKEEKWEDGQYRLSAGTQNQTHEQTMVGSSDPSIFWNGTSINAWLDPSSNIGSSVSSLI
ncbi:hypothetical protein Ancab_005181 [Ancistrocladus abbreviatus]